MASVSNMVHLIEQINTCLPANKGIDYGRSSRSKYIGEYGYVYTLYACLYSSNSRNTIISKKELLTGSLKDCRLFLEGMIMMEKIKISN